MFDDEGVFDNPLFLAYRARILSLAEKHGLAVMGARVDCSTLGGLFPEGGSTF